VRLKDDPVHLSLLTGSQKDGQLESVLMGLDVLGRVPWRINEKILGIAIELWNQGVNVSEVNTDGVCNSSTTSPKINSTTTNESDINNNTTSNNTEYPFMKRDDFERVEDYREYCREAVSFRNEQTRQHSMTCDTNYKLEIARTFAGIPFYLPHSVDFRGRAYPIPPHLSHIGSDLSRGLLEFSEGRELGERGLFWLKVQFSNMCGNDKCSLDDRAAFTESKMEVIRKCARDPLALDSFWRSADEPWQCLATCIEIIAASESEDPSKFISHLPVQQDGSCNGSQHYAALGGDVDGAAQVNLSPSPVPQDIYGTVAKIVSRDIDRDVADFDSRDEVSVNEKDVLTERTARCLQGKINRKIVKQPVMTNIYGVTQYGAKKQIEARLKEFSLIPPGDEALMRRAREYLTVKVFSALDELFVKARQIQSWLEFCAVEICRSVPHPIAERYGFTYDSFIPDSDSRVSDLRKRNVGTWNPCKSFSLANDLEMTDRYPQTPVTWTTPLAFRVLQPYLKSTSVQLRTVLQLCSLQQSSQFDAVDAGKQVAAFPPNFIHSLDATHMFRTALACFQSEITFASVHDCFWTHAATVDAMNRLIRQEFVSMHTEPILDRLRAEFLALYRNYKVPVVLKTVDGKKENVWRNIYIPPLPERGEFDLNQVLESKYFFS
jgi:DNA-directed RNA polymerase, mitochondrial